MANLPFVPYDFPQCDFIITLNDNEQIQERLTKLGASRVQAQGFALYLWDPRPADVFFFGVGVVDEAFKIGPQHLNRLPTKLGAGNYTILDIKPSTAKVIPDPFGMNLTFYSEVLVTNRLHLASLVVDDVDVVNAFSAFHGRSGFSLNFNTLETPVRGVKLLKANSTISIEDGKILPSQANEAADFTPLDPDDYWTFIERGAEEIIHNVAAVIDSGQPAIADVTGGRDSRIVFGALIASGKHKHALFNTISNPTSQMLETDLRIATGLVDHYGGQYGGGPRAIGYSQTSVANNLRRRRSQLYGAYHWLTSAGIRPLSELRKTTSVRMLGGGGELYRDSWRKIEFPWQDPAEQATATNIETMLNRHRGRDFKNSLPLDYLDQLNREFENLDGNTIGDKIDSHYFNLRCRLHFGARPVLTETSTSINLATSTNLLRAYRGLPVKERTSGRVIFDVLSVFDSKLPYFELEVPFSDSIFESNYNRGSRLYDAPIPLKGKPELAQNRVHRRSPVIPILPPKIDWSYSEVVESEISESLNLLSKTDTEFAAFVTSEDMSSFLAWAREKSPVNLGATASKLRFFADLLHT
ncbi:hypothetical protein CSTAT_04200 [Corynebacterium stationis]|uniref:hypothetical protein n=1 Tax=Corynebacterium stationis TaxID=1705 RepID=UPI000950A53B|nr:hypothetical protein [Corynebacterium stationis]APT94567.1 hypothetical protein CSTAT_04200 [Corynebacterium stationis]